MGKLCNLFLGEDLHSAEALPWAPFSFHRNLKLGSVFSIEIGQTNLCPSGGLASEEDLMVWVLHLFVFFDGIAGRLSLELLPKRREMWSSDGQGRCRLRSKAPETRSPSRRSGSCTACCSWLPELAAELTTGGSGRGGGTSAVSATDIAGVGCGSGSPSCCDT